MTASASPMPETGPLREQHTSPNMMRDHYSDVIHPKPDSNHVHQYPRYHKETNQRTTSVSSRNGTAKDEESSRPETTKGQEQSKAIKTRTIVIGLFYGLVSGLFFAACAASVKYLDDLDPGQIAFYQYIAITVLALPMVVKGGLNVLGPHKETKYWFLLCGVFDAVTVYLSFISFKRLPLSDATVITSSVPVFVTVSARIFLREKCGMCQVVAIAISVAGVAMVSRVPLLMAERTEDIYTRDTLVGLLAALGSMATESGVYIVLRRLHDVDPYVILFNFGVVATLVNVLLTCAFGTFSWTLCGLEQWLVLAVGAFSFLSQLALAKALEIEDAGPVSVLMAAGDIMLAFILDMTLFHDKPDAYTISGTVLVVTSVMLVGFKKWIDGNLKKTSLKMKLLKLFT